jgi:predicted transcriptional regulator
MDEKLLCQFGLSKNQAHTYRLLVDRKSLRPSQLAKITDESRANCYVILDKLVELGLAKRVDVDRKLTYFPENPIVFEKILSDRAAQAQGKLSAAQQAMPRLMSAFSDSKDQPKVTQYKGKAELRGMYDQQMEEDDNHLYFIRSTADIPFFGLQDMEVIRRLAHAYKKRRFGLTPVVFYGPSHPEKDAATNLKRTWLPKAAYTAPVEWAVSGDITHIINFKGEGSGIAIKNREIAESLRQIFQLFSEALKNDPDYKNNPKVTKTH